MPLPLYRLEFWNNVLSANSLGAGSILPMNQTPVIFDFFNDASQWVVPSDGAVLAYQPGIAGLKNGGLTVDSTLSNSKTWQATPFDTIQDTITLVPGANSSADGRADFIKQLMQLQRQANAYSIESSEYRPVFICVKEYGDAGERFSRIYDIQWAFSGNPFANEYANQQLTLTVTRYPFWTPIPLGTNPKWYTFLARGLTPDQFLVPPEVAVSPTDMAGYSAQTVGTASSVSDAAEGYTPDIGFGSNVKDWVSGTTNNGYVEFGDTGLGIVTANVEESTEYELIVWLRSESSSYDAVPLRLVVVDQGGATLATGSNFQVPVSSNWVKQRVVFTTGAGDTGVVLRIQKNTSATNASYDIYGISVKATANPMSLTDYGNADPNLQNWVESDVRNIWTRADPANLRLNYVDIAAEDIPGDAPALMSIVVDRNNSTSITDVNLYIARRLDAISTEALYTQTFMAQGSTLASPTGITSTYQSDNGRGITSTPGGAASARYAMQFVTGAGAISDAAIASWELSNVPQSGKVAVFLRGGLTAGVAADIPMYVRFYVSSSLSVEFIVRTQSRSLSAGVSSSYPALTYMGSLDMTLIKNAVRLADGLGVGVSRPTLQLRFGGRSAGAAATYRVTDLLLIPYDDLFAAMVGLNMTNEADIERYALYDNTGYFNQNADAIGLLHQTAPPPNNDTYEVCEVQGQSMVLEPNRNNRLYFLLGSSTTSPTNDSTLSFVTLRTRLNIVPQWRRIRSV